MRKLLVLSSVVLLIAALATLNSAGAQEDPNPCPPPTDLGELGDILTASGTWSTEECDNSEFLENRPGQRFLFSLAEEAEVRIDLSSASRDALVYLQADDGRLIDADDDTGGGVDARIERTLPAGTYQIEASTVGWSGRETGTFELTLRVVAGCQDVVELGVLEDKLNTEAVWSHFGCESAFRPDRSSQRYRFALARAARVQIDLTSAIADSYVYLLDDSDTLLDSDDDGGVQLNSRIVRTLGTGSYIIEATNWGDRDLKNLQEAPYQLSIGLAEAGPSIKLEAIDAPDRVVLGMPFEIDYRVGNLGDSALSSVNGSVQVRVRWPYVSNWRTPRIGAGDEDAERWAVGASYHTSESVSAFGSQPLSELQPFDAEFTSRRGPTDLMLEVLVLDERGQRIDRHWLTRPIMVLSGIEFKPVTVSVDDVEYQVTANAADDGEVTTEVKLSSADEPADEPADGAPADDEESADEVEALDPEITSRAIYAAGVRTQVLGDAAAVLERLGAQAASLFSRVQRGGLPLSEVASPSAPTLDAMVQTLNAAHSETLVNARFEPQQFQSVNTAEGIVVRAGRAAARRVERLVRNWSELAAGDPVLSADDALLVHSELAFAIEIDARLIEAADLVLTKRDAKDGWDDPDVSAVLDAFAAAIDCDVDSRALSFSDGALRALLPLYGFMLDRAYCGAVKADDDHDLLLTGLDLSGNPLIPAPEVEDEPASAPSVAARWLLARVLEDGRVEFGVNLTSGQRVLPNQGLLSVDVPLNLWLTTAPIWLDGVELGRIFARRLSVGLVQATYVPTGGDRRDTQRWIVPADAPTDAWLVSGELDRGPGASGDDLVQRIADQAAGPGTAQFGDHLSLLALIENDLQRNP